ncbi:hypothetical protein [Rhodoflexus sp.]
MLYALLHLLIVPPVLHKLTKKLRPQPLGAVFLPGLLLKVAAGWAVIVVLQRYYGGGDVMHTFQQSMLLREILLESALRFWQFPYDMPQGDFYYLYGFPDLTPSFVFICKITALVSLTTGENIWLISSWFSAFAFAGFWLLGNELCRRNNDLKIPVLIAFFLVPSVVFWSAGLLKETLLWGALGLLFWAALRLRFGAHGLRRIPQTKADFLKGKIPHRCSCPHEQHPYNSHEQQTTRRWFVRTQTTAEEKITAVTQTTAVVIIAILSAWLILQVKYYIFAAAVLAVAVYWLLQWQKKLWQFFLTALILLPLLLWAIGQLHPNLSPDALAIAVHRNYERMVAISDADNLIWLDLQPDFISLISQVPFALKAALFSPMPWESGNLLRKLTGMENLLLLLLALGIRLPRSNRYLAEIMAAALFTAALAAMLTLSSPNIGALARYKVSYLPLLWLLVCSSNRFLQTLPFQKLKALF